MEKEFNLSEKIMLMRNGIPEYNPDGDYIEIYDVEEFIKRLKEEIMNLDGKFLADKRTMEAAIMEIDKLAGEKLI